MEKEEKTRMQDEEKEGKEKENAVNDKKEVEEKAEEGRRGGTEVEKSRR